MDTGSINSSKPEEVDLNEEVKKRVELFKPKFSGKIVLKCDADSKTYSLPKQDFLQVLYILLDNATKYGEKRIAVSLSKSIISISNDGATISKDDVEKVFDRFYQTDKTKDGSGLGLAICKALCEQNGWDISCVSEKRNTTFVLRLA